MKKEKKSRWGGGGGDVRRSVPVRGDNPHTSCGEGNQEVVNGPSEVYLERNEPCTGKDNGNAHDEAKGKQHKYKSGIAQVQWVHGGGQKYAWAFDLI